MEDSPAHDDPSIHDVLAAGYATRRWINIVVAIAMSDEDLPTLVDWSHAVHKSVGTLKRWCQLCDVNAGDSLDLGRALRVVRRYRGKRCRWYEDLSIAEPATLRRFLSRAGMSRDVLVPDFELFLHQQHFVTELHLVNALRLAFAQKH